jgi:CHAT domain-containing protein
MRLAARWLLGLSLLAASCAEPPPGAYLTRGGAGPGAGQEIQLGKDASGEACTAQPTGPASADVYCGTWKQPSARVLAAAGTDLAALANASPWRAEIDARYACGPATSTTVLGGRPALLMQCTRRVGGWPHVALVADAGGRAWLADGVLPATPAMERTIGVLSGQISASAAPPSSGAQALLADRLAARAFGSSDIGLSDELMNEGSRANQAGNSVSAENAYRAALAVQQKAFGKNDPRTSTTLARLALQISNQGRFDEAKAMFRQAEQLAPRDRDNPVAVPQVYHYEALSLIQQGKPQEALPLLARAEAGYAALLPANALRPGPAQVASVDPFASRALARFQPLFGNGDLVRNPIEKPAIDGTVEVRRYRAIALLQLGRTDESAAALGSARDLQRATGGTQSLAYARLSRNSGLMASALGESARAIGDLSVSEDVFGRNLPGSKPLVETFLLRAGELARAGRPSDALSVCRQAVAGLVTLKAGVRPELLAPCLDLYADQAKAAPDKAQAVLGEMFLASQLAQGNTTVQQIARAAVRLQEGARDPKVGNAIRQHDDALEKLAALERARDEFAARPRAPGTPGPDTSALDQQIADAQAAVRDSESALQAAAPNYGQLVQEVVPARDVFAALRPGEAFAQLTVGGRDGWTFLLRDDKIDVAKIAVGAGQLDGLVRRVRASVEFGERGLPKFDTAAAQQLYALTLAGIAPAMNGVQRVTFAPSGPLLAMPFEIMLTGPADASNLAQAPWLVRQAVIAHVPAAANFVSLRKSAGSSHATQPWFGFGDFRRVTLQQAERLFPTANCADSARLLANLPPLNGAVRELEAARQLLHADKSDQLLGPAFTVAAVTKAPLHDFRVLHFATHAVLPSELACQRDPAIITSAPPTAPDASAAMLTSNDILNLNLDADLVILSACNSGGLAGSLAGESLSDLARSFFFAGARSLLITHWAVSDQVGAYLVAETLRRGAENPSLGAAGALHDAQLALLADAGKGLPAEIAHPFYWAPFAVIGNGGGASAAQRGAAAL